ncbi:S-methyl-5-thioribose-1-phosphate isomerase [Nocardia macrotermitis]|uniref:Methylthioribose-1-phosphate isomerase n=1 Tax=Nocardia macrotermitis TaxID=2585198 RepID=A0A7K0D8X1_9NOCA|nr:S-methyl-5-thioribose-1-phosphate isomerase [Nocardia macrotermitis]MQY22158.1 putative methylthioribose-1-phosphate isomerase [Nocardia macrotermitis]
MGESSISWDRGAVVVIDQRALPGELRWLRISTVDEVIEAIATLAVRGAPAIGVTGAFGVALAAFAHEGDDAAVTAEARRIAAVRPTAVNLSWAVARALARLPGGARAVLAEAQALLAQDGRVNRAAAERAADLVQRVCPDRPLRVLTHCNTGRLATTSFGTALGAIRVLAAREAIESVLVDETRPLLQGARLTAWELAEAGIAHRLTIDAAAAWAMATGQVDCVLVGADRITADGAVANKIGTYALALAAARHRIPFVVVAPESTRDPGTATGAQIVVEQRAAAEITEIAGVPTAPEGTAVFNPAFDVTPPDLITAVVTENGVVYSTLDDGLAGARSAGIAAGPEGGPVAAGGVRTAVGVGDDTAPRDGTSGIPARDGGCGPEVVAGQRIAGIARSLYARGWMPGTAGNISVRLGEDALITGSGLSKGELRAADMVRVRVADSVAAAGARRASAETAIHTAIYRATEATAVVHVHPPYATALSADAGPGPDVLRFSGYELIKGLGAAVSVGVPVVSNHADVARIGAEVEALLRADPQGPPVLFIAGHGITAWGASLAQARDRAECLEALCELVRLTGRREIGVLSGAEEGSK